MDAASRFAALARQGLPFYDYAGEFCKLAAATAWDDATLNHLFWLGANFHHPVDLPDTTGLSWREGNFRCLGSVRARDRTSPPLFAGKSTPPSVAHSGRLPFAAPANQPPVANVSTSPSTALSLPPFAAPSSPPPSAANASQPPVAIASPPPSAANASQPPVAIANPLPSTANARQPLSQARRQWVWQARQQ